MSDLFTVDELALRLQLDADTATAYAARLALLRDEATGLVLEAAGSPANPPSTLKTIALNAAGRAWANPDGRSQEAIGAYSSGFTGAGGLYLTDQERQRCRTASGLGRPTGSFPPATGWPDPPRRAT